MGVVEFCARGEAISCTRLPKWLTEASVSSGTRVSTRARTQFLEVKGATHAAAFLDGLGVETCDVLGFSLGGMVAQRLALDRPAICRRLILVGTAPRGGEDIMHLDKPRLATHLQDPSNRGYGVLQKIFLRNR